VRIGCILDYNNDAARSAFSRISTLYGAIDLEVNPDYDFEVVVTLGGDGVMLRALHKFMGRSTPFFGMNRGSIGFLLNSYREEGLIARIQNGVTAKLNPLSVKVTTDDEREFSYLAINEVSLMRETQQAAKIDIFINNTLRLNNLVADGILLATPAGSSAYNYAVGGPIIPMSSNIMSLRAISPFRPRNWRGALILRSDTVRFDVLEQDKRPVSVSADSVEIRRAKTIEVEEKTDIVMSILFDPEDRLEERALKEQFI
jgi:NAD+ kinase